MQQQLSVSQALGWILFSILLISGSAGIALLYYCYAKEGRKFDEAYTIVAIAQSTDEIAGLKTAYFAELLGLSVDNPSNLYAFNVQTAERILQASPVIKKATVQKIQPGMIRIDYALRKPIAFLGDYTNSVIDRQGVVFPFKPFFTPKRLPELFLGQDENINLNQLWGSSLRGRRLDLALAVLDVVTTHCCSHETMVRRVDVSQAYAPSQGQRQIVVILEEPITAVEEGQLTFHVHSYFLRLSPDNYQKQLANYLILNNYLHEKNSRHLPTVVDLRLSDLAFIQGKNHHERIY